LSPARCVITEAVGIEVVADLLGDEPRFLYPPLPTPGRPVVEAAADANRAHYGALTGPTCQGRTTTVRACETPPWVPSPGRTPVLMVICFRVLWMVWARTPVVEVSVRVRSAVSSPPGHLLETKGVEEAVTLRSIAKEVGITAPAIYTYFPDRDAILETVITEAFAELNRAITDALAPITIPVERLHAGCDAYIDFGLRQPATYRILFARPHPSRLPAVADQAAGLFAVVVNTIADCAAAGTSASTDPYTDAVAVWMGIHGLATLPPANPRFPWPHRETLTTECIDRLARITG
jgi:AcrR family transcriptional regulator